MGTEIRQLREALDRLEGVAGPGDVTAYFSSASDDATVALASVVEDLRRLVDAVSVTAAGEIAYRSPSGMAVVGLARERNHRTPVSFLAELARTSVSDASMRCRVGSALRQPVSLTGEPLPHRYPVLARAVEAGSVGLASADRILFTLDSARDTASSDTLRVAEEHLVTHATVLDTATLNKIAARWAVHLDPDGVAPREEVLREKRGIRVGPERNGMVHGTFDLDPRCTAVFRAFFDSAVGPRTAFRSNDVDACPDSAAEGSAAEGSAAADDAAARPDNDARPDDAWGDTPRRDDGDPLYDGRSRPQKMLDALVNVMTESMQRKNLPDSGGLAPTLVITAPLSTLLEGTGVGWLDGSAEPVSDTTVAELACTADIVLLGLGTDGQPLAQRDPRRRFTRAQRRALAARDGGCVFPGCHAPPGWTEAHHVTYWSHHGPTAIDNGVLLCSFHHHRVHGGGWSIVMKSGLPYLRPPTWIDFRQKLVPAGRTALDNTIHHAATAHARLASQNTP